MYIPWKYNLINNRVAIKQRATSGEREEEEKQIIESNFNWYKFIFYKPFSKNKQHLQILGIRYK